MAVNPAILEDDESLSVDSVEHSLTLTSLSEIPRASPSPHPHAGDEPTIRGERLSSIDMRDLPPLQDDDMADQDSQVDLLKFNARALRLKSSVHKSRIRQALPRPQPQPNDDNLTDGKARSRSSSIAQHAQNREFLRDARDARTPFQDTSVPDVSNRASSPDVASFLATTPRPRRRSETSTSSKSSQSRWRTHKSLPSSSRASAVGRLSVFSLPDQPRQGSASLTSQSLLAYAGNADDGDEFWNDDSLLEDYGVAIGNGGGDFANGLDEDDATGDSDSSLDLHTPLPCVPFFLNSAGSSVRIDICPTVTLCCGTGCFLLTQNCYRRTSSPIPPWLLRTAIGMGAWSQVSECIVVCSRNVADILI